MAAGGEGGGDALHGRRRATGQRRGPPDGADAGPAPAADWPAARSLCLSDAALACLSRASPAPRAQTPPPAAREARAACPPAGRRPGSRAAAAEGLQERRESGTPEPPSASVRLTATALAPPVRRGPSVADTQ